MTITPTGGFPLLSALIAVPLLGIPLMWATRDREVQRRLRIGVALLELALAVVLLAGFRADESQAQWTERMPWMGTLGAHYQLGVDGISVLFVPLTALLFALLFIGGEQERAQAAGLLGLESMLIGAFSAQDMLLFFLFWELILAPTWFLIAFFGIGPQRRETATRYSLFMLAASAPMLVGFALLANDHSGSFSIAEHTARPVSALVQGQAFFLLFIGLAAKAPMFPVHSWLRPLIAHSSTGVAVIMGGLKLGIYGMMRILLPLAPDAAAEHAPLIVGLALAGVIYGSVVALAVADLKSVLAASTVAHVGMIVAGLFSGNMQGLQGAHLHALNLGLVSTGLIFLAGAIQSRSGSLDVAALGGLACRMPRLTALFLVFAMASIGLPGSSGFPAELLILIGAFRAHPAIGVVALSSLVLGAACMLGTIARAFFGRPRESSAWMPDLLPGELLVAGTLAALVLVVGCFPNLVLDVSRAAFHEH